MSNLSTGVLRDLTMFIHSHFQIDNFIETGTFMGDTTSFASTLFNHVITIEKDPAYYEAAQKKFHKTVNVSCRLGDSAEKMKELNVFYVNTKTMFWLDAHDVDGQFGQGGDDCPLMAELEAINKSSRDHIILIDDAHCYMPPLPPHLNEAVWPTLAQIQNWCKDAQYECVKHGDVFVLAGKKDMDAITEFLGNLETVQRSLFTPRITCTAAVEQTPLKRGAVPTVLPAFTGLVHTDYGWMLVHRFDTAQTPYLSQTGKSRDDVVISKLVQYVRKRGYGSVFVDVGANFGCFSFAMRKYCKEVHAFEAQRIIYNMLAGSVALNGWLNVFTYNVAIGADYFNIEIPQFDYNRSLSFGSIEFGAEQKEQLAQTRMDTNNREFVIQKPLDAFDFDRVDLLKIDVEGMELEVLAGAHSVIVECRPIIMIEHLKSDKVALRTKLEEFDYNIEDIDTDNWICSPKESAE